MRSREIVRFVGIACAALFFARGAEAQPKTEAQVLREFQSKIDAYMELHKKLEKDVPPLKTESTPEEIRATKKALAAKMRVERPDTVQGYFFTPETRTLFRQRIRGVLTGPRGNEIRTAILEDAPAPLPLRVNSEYPDGWPVS